MTLNLGLILLSAISLSAADSPWMSTITDPAGAACTASCSHDEIHYLNRTWTSYITPVTVGTVIVIVDDANNKTTTTTSYMTEVVKDNTTYPVSGFFQNGTFIGGSPPSTTQVNYIPLTDFGINSTATVTYPTQLTYFYGTTLKWGGILNYTSNGVGICTSYPEGPSILPSHTPLASQTATAPYDPNDPYGAYYTLTLALPNWLVPDEVSSIYDNDPQLNAIYGNCISSLSSPGEPLSSVTALLETSTSHISGGMSSPSSTSSASPASTSMMTTAPATSSTTSLPTASTETSLAQQSPSHETSSQRQTSETIVGSDSVSFHQTKSSTTSSCTDIGCQIISVINSEPTPSNQPGTSKLSAVSSLSSAIIPGSTSSEGAQPATGGAQSTEASATTHANIGSSAPDTESTKQSAVPFSSSATPTSDTTQATQEPPSGSSSSSPTVISTSSATRLSTIGSLTIALMTIGIMAYSRSSSAAFQKIGLGLFFVLSLSQIGGVFASTITAGPAAPTPADAKCLADCHKDQIYIDYLTWTQYITPVVVGTKLVIVDDSTNMTTTTTSYLTEIVNHNTTYPVSGFLQNGTLVQGPRPSTTQIAYVPLTDNGIDSTATVTYPTAFTYLRATELIWGGVLNYTSSGSVYCTSRDRGPSPLPSHTPLPSDTLRGPVDPNDPYGSYYTLTIAEPDYLFKDQVSSIYHDPQLDAIYSLCTGSAAGPGFPLTSVSALLATSTIHISSSATAPTTTSADPASANTLTTISMTPSPTSSELSSSTTSESSTSSSESSFVPSTSLSSTEGSSAEPSSTLSLSKPPLSVSSFSQQSGPPRSQTNTQIGSSEPQPTSEPGTVDSQSSKTDLISQSQVVAPNSMTTNAASVEHSQSNTIYSASSVSETPQSTQETHNGPSSSVTAKSSADETSKITSMVVAIIVGSLVKACLM